MSFRDENKNKQVFMFSLSDPWDLNFRPAVGSSDGPIFDNSLVTNVTAQFGGTAHLQCKVLNIKNGDDNVSSFSYYFFH